ncbi:hypothetical protein XELAEV_18042876mg [Xenopus laevis]|uniref:Uncharacterized protein n=1 Tax=Xenopus laevis TaxID=8355 RepID=A0A974C4R8_XENLA|nr:hypothetical protein XELAEV_18042876mg [Xenopus laevis]
MVLSFRVSELQVLLGFAGRNKSGRKHELLTKTLLLLRSGCIPAVQMKIKELYRRRFPRKVVSSTDLTMLHMQGGALPSANSLAQGSVCHMGYDTSSASPTVSSSMLPPVPMLGPKHETDLSHLTPPIHPVHPDVKMKRLPFYDVYDELIKPTTLASTNTQRFEEAHFNFALTPQQVHQILSSRDLLPGAKCDYTVQVQLRFCLCETSCPQEDYFPPNLFVKVNQKLCPLPVIKEKLTADPDSEIATTSLRVSLMCPLGKMRLTVPCRAITCTHLQCFDAALYLQMNEKKPTWTCPVCDKKAPYDMLIIDGLFMDILNSCTDCDEIQFVEDGSWCPMRPKKEKQDICQPTQYGGIEASSIYSMTPELKHKPETKKKVEVIDLTLDSSSDDDEPPSKKQCPVTSAAIPSAAGLKGVISVDHQPSSVLRSPPMATISSDYLSSLPLQDYHRSYTVPPDMQGLDLFSFLQADSTHYSPSVITSLDEQDTLSHFFQYRGPPAHYMSPLSQTITGSHSTPTSASRISSIVSTSSMRESHSHNTSQNNSSALPGCRPDIISLD